MFILVLAAYFTPAIVAQVRHHPNAGAIFALNFFLGWTFLGWIAAFVWALTNPQRQCSYVVQTMPIPQIDAWAAETPVNSPAYWDGLDRLNLRSAPPRSY